MATIASHLRMIDQFSAPLRRVANQTQSAIQGLERMRRLVERPVGDISVRIDTSQALHDAANLGSRISSQIGRIEANVQLNVNAQLSGAMGSLDSSIDRLRIEIEHLTQAIQNGGGPGGGPGGNGGSGINIIGGMGNLLGIAAGVLGGAALINGTTGGAADQQQLQGTLQAQVGIDEGQAAALLQSVKNVYAAGWGESLQAVSNDVATVRQNLKGLSQEASAAYTQSAYAVEQVAKGETDIGELSKVTRTLMANFQGLSETKALDLITTGFQRGGNYAKDLLDTVNEYSVHFSGLGMSAEQMFATLIAGSEQGAWNLDKVGDAVKESFIRMKDLSDTSKEAFTALGMDSNKMAAQIAAGGESANRAYQATLMALGKMDNATDRNTVGLKIFGTMWEDLQDSVILAMQEGQKGLGDFEGATAKAAAALQNNLGFQLEVFQRNFALGFAQAGQGSVEALMPLITTLNEAFQDGKFQPFFDGLAAGLTFAAQTIAMLVENALWLSDVISNNWSWIEPIIWGIVGALGAYLLLTQGMTVALWLANAAQAALNAIMNANPFVLIATLIIGVITALVTLWNTNDAFAAGLLRVWNGILNFFDQIPIFFTWVGNGIADAFDWAKVQSLKIVEQLANGVIDQINWVITQLNKIPGVSLETFDHLEISASAAAEAEAARQSRAAKLEGMKQNAVQKAAEREAKVQEFIKDRQDKRAKKEAEKAAQKNSKSAASGAAKAATKANIPGRVSTPKMPTIGVDDKDKNVAKVGKVGQVDKVKGKVDISSEDLKMMRELAEMKNIQNFVTIKPSVNFGDTHVRHESDIDTIVAHITEKLEQDIASSADAVYG
ncbi:phage tail tape measure protein [Paenibacillus sp. VCA1]|uniref:phage tail tape measure protein n=1 Tax=Paenibacillus sp. VCA1 TaxID=3039148 RepID=UPI002870C96B|nr:phage tail tape measure protein [Paenibacillus sp. VCA1]MDR9857816.1 phage tail tape measure protein [Paenibacillus sp. VCA1]